MSPAISLQRSQPFYMIMLYSSLSVCSSKWRAPCVLFIGDTVIDPAPKPSITIVLVSSQLRSYGAPSLSRAAEV